MDYEQVVDVLAMDKSMLEEELRAAKLKLQLYDRLVFIMLGSFPVVCVGFDCKWLRFRMQANGYAICKWVSNLQMLVSKWVSNLQMGKQPANACKQMGKQTANGVSKFLLQMQVQSKCNLKMLVANASAKQMQAANGAMVLMVERNRGEHLIRRFAKRGNGPDPRDVKIASLKQRIQELEFLQLQQDSPAEETETESNVWDDGSEDVNPFGEKNLGFHDDHYDNPLKSMPVYDTDIEDVIEEEEEFVEKGRFGGEEDNIEDVVVVANDLCSSMIQTILSVNFEKDINTKSHELMSFEKSIIIK
ncbi:hypothetical protein Tco_0459745, partial [Tanacetum coccineum]